MVISLNGSLLRNRADGNLIVLNEDNLRDRHTRQSLVFAAETSTSNLTFTKQLQPAYKHNSEKKIVGLQYTLVACTRPNICQDKSASSELWPCCVLKLVNSYYTCLKS